MLYFVDALLSFFLEDMPPQPRWKTPPETGDADDDDFDDDDDAKQQKKKPPLITKKRFTMGYWQMRGLGAPLRMMLHWGKFDNKTNATKALMDDGKRRGRSRTCNTRKVPTASPRGTNEIKRK